GGFLLSAHGIYDVPIVNRVLPDSVGGEGSQRDIQSQMARKLIKPGDFPGLKLIPQDTLLEQFLLIPQRLVHIVDPQPLHQQVENRDTQAEGNPTTDEIQLQGDRKSVAQGKNR